MGVPNGAFFLKTDHIRSEILRDSSGAKESAAAAQHATHGGTNGKETDREIGICGDKGGRNEKHSSEGVRRSRADASQTAATAGAVLGGRPGKARAAPANRAHSTASIICRE